MKKKMIILLQVLIATVLIGTSVYAAIDTTLELKANLNTVKRGEEILVTMSLKDVPTSSKVTGVSGYINYNKNVFEKLTVDSIVKGTDGKVTIGNENLPIEDLTDATLDNMPNTDAYVGFNANPSKGNDVRIVMIFKNGVSQDSDLITLKFKAKSDATLGEIKEAVKYDLFVLTVGNQKTGEISKSIDVTIKDIEKAPSTKDENKVDENKVNENKVDENKVNENKVNENKVNENKVNENKVNENKANTSNLNTLTVGSTNVSGKNKTVDNTVAAAVIPAAGARAVVIPAIILILCAYIFYNRYMKYKEF